MQALKSLGDRALVPEPSGARSTIEHEGTRAPPSIELAVDEPEPSAVLREGVVAEVGTLDFLPPRFPSGLVRRPRLVRRLLDERQASTTIVCAPPGYGKTTLLADWIEREERPCAWITLVRQPRDSTALLEMLVLALNELEPVDDRLFSACGHSRRVCASEPSPELLAALIATISAMGTERRPAVLVLDNAHLLKTRTMRVLAAVAAAMPASAKLALASRSAITLPLGRLRAEHKLLELGHRELALTTLEARRVLRDAGLTLDRDAIEHLLVRTEGWPAALYLAGRSLCSQSDIDSAMKCFSGVDRLIWEYVRQELLKPLARNLCNFLLRSSSLDYLSAPLCNAVLDRSDSAAVLETLAFHDLVLLPLDTDHIWYRCHPLVRDVLRAELAVRDPDAMASVPRRASRWFETQGDIDRAVDQATAVGDGERVGRLLWAHAADFLMRSGDPRTRRWLGCFPDERIARSSHLALCAAAMHLMAPNLPTAQHWTRVASSAPAPHKRKDRQVIEGGIALMRAATGQDGIEHMGMVARQARVWLGEDNPWSSFCYLLEGVADHVVGERAKARGEFEMGVRASATLMPIVECLCMTQLAMMDAEEGELTRSADGTEAVAELVACHGLARDAYVTLMFSVSAWIAGRQGRGDEAKRDLTHAMRLLDQFGGFMPWYEVETRLAIARASVQLADVGAARASLSRASRVLRHLPDAPRLHTWLDDCWAQIDEHSASALAGPASLTMAELRILRFLPTHLTFREIGGRLCLSTNTVKTEAHAVYRKLGATSRSQAVAEASALGLIEPSII
jgi:LuxR family transcriptional regulator, maltose regulon positive regulatory protein